MIKSLFGTLLILIGGAGALYATSRSQDIADWWKLRSYETPSEVALLSVNAGFNEYGQRLFYVHDPQLLDKQEFADKCTVGEATIVLGCYIHDYRIYLFDVTDERLEGVEEVTAAHEMLHAAYDRLSEQEQEEISAALLAFYDTVTDPRIIKTVQTYEERDPDVVHNELHSIIGTEILDLPEELELHYQQYFSDRSKVVELAQEYAEVFTMREKQIEQFDTRLKNIQTQIDVIETDLQVQAATLSVQRGELNALRDTDIQQYNERIDPYNVLVRAYNDDVAALKASVTSYNTTVAERNALALEERELVEAIDTRIDEL